MGHDGKASRQQQEAKKRRNCCSDEECSPDNLCCVRLFCQHVPGEEGTEREGMSVPPGSIWRTTIIRSNNPYKDDGGGLCFFESSSADAYHSRMHPKMPQRLRHRARHCLFRLFCLPVPRRQAEVLFFLFISSSYMERATHAT